MVMIGMANRQKMTRRKTQIRGMTAIERAMGRFMRGPDGHDDASGAAEGGEGGGDPDAGSEGDAGAAEGGSDEGTVLGGDSKGEEGSEAGAEEGEGGDEAAASEGPPEAYELTPPDGMDLDAETLAEADPIFRELGLSNDAAQKLIPVAGKFAERIATQTREASEQAMITEVVAQRKAWAKEARDDAEIGGANWDETVELSAKALDALGYPKGSPFRNFLTDTGLGNHPEMIRAMRTVGELTGEDGDFVRGDTGALVKPDRLSALYPNDVPKTT